MKNIVVAFNTKKKWNTCWHITYGKFMT